MALDESDLVTYIPEHEDNRDSDNPWSVKLSPMTAGEHRKYLKAAHIKLNGESSASKAIDVLAKIFKERVLEVSNLTDIRNREITNGAELFENGEQSQIDDVYSALTKASKLRAGVKKTS
tara:strand:+ start:9567 stop:9926 length:360 start_codon:yes stop_codon:yes gene_type:complete